MQRAIQLKPSYATAHQWYATMLTAMGRCEEAHREVRRALELDPLSPAIGIAAAGAHLMCGDAEQAVKQLERTKQIAPDLFSVYAWLVVVYLETGRLDDALRAGERCRELNESVANRSLALVHARMGNRDEALRLLELSRHPRPPWAGMAPVYMVLGETDQALEALERAFDEDGWSFFTLHRTFLLYLNVLPWFAPLRSEPRFQALVNRLRFPNVRA